MISTPNKMEMEKDSVGLQLYMFTVQQGGIAVEVAEDFKAIMAYSDIEAFDKVRKDYAVGQQISIRQRAKVLVRKIVDSVNIETSTSWDFRDFKINVEATPLKEKTAQDFICGLMLIADKFVIDKRDQASIKRIINKIKI